MFLKLYFLFEKFDQVCSLLISEKKIHKMNCGFDSTFVRRLLRLYLMNDFSPVLKYKNEKNKINHYYKK